MTTSTIEQPVVDAGPAAYRVTATQHNAHDGPYLLLECPFGDNLVMPGPCVGNLLGRRIRQSTFLGTLARTAITHDARHTIQTRTNAARLRQQIAELGDYYIGADHDQRPSLIFNCPYLATGHASACPDTTDGQCVTNLLTPAQAAGTVTIGTLLRLAAAHQAARQPATPQEPSSADYAALTGRLAALQQVWTGRQREAVYTRETADGPSAGIAGARADLIGQMLSDLSRAVNGG
ncbi:hypothetical protein HCN51_31630 [Nonomuraea sp. FMUSA5-5]|uniref:Uncharacterized protein n=1 Tax=Nonomuraea composti TaxID=2720023 RepID=A0ABX1BF48_9ACTN|nr:hypothetical protein [Nonomuraea sp. FMUSA5-5]NJP93936.1 hypothetical protein [Nonomuraea sp. FMUSA5-5]